MREINLQELLEAGVHFGHQVRRGNPKMRQYIYTARDGVNIIDLALTAEQLAKAREFIRQAAKDKAEILFVGTKRQAKEIIKEEAKRCQVRCVSGRWVGGTITNWDHIQKSIHKLTELKQARDSGEWKKYNKKEQAILRRELERLEKLFGGLEGMEALPDVLFVIDAKREENAVIEANKKNIPVVAMVDTNSDPDLVDYVIPSNDDAIRSISLITSLIAEAIMEGKGIKMEVTKKEEEKKPKGKTKGKKKEEVKEIVTEKTEAHAEEIEERFAEEEVEEEIEETKRKAKRKKEQK